MADNAQNSLVQW